ncbi:hypothetical protein SUBVAR_04747 [Subdoligranulum variabile DSM 15176]|uniref:Uncharacterized protein n=1 Tax=Subdoligranulum variabile DSM 15176 TaxID=411471 RepID=D1PK27_9FIRM|nr:hypothetical protein SUBVAR_04747 [Subdoligranulum variabile DSM 15176]
MQLMAQQKSIVQNAVVGNGKVGTVAGKVSVQIAGKGMIVIIGLGIPLCSHPYMAHDYTDGGRCQKQCLVGGFGAFVDVQPVMDVVGNTGASVPCTMLLNDKERRR